VSYAKYHAESCDVNASICFNMLHNPGPEQYTVNLCISGCFIHAMLLPYLKVKTGFEEYLIHRQLWGDLCPCYEESSQYTSVEILQHKQKMTEDQQNKLTKSVKVRP
jgi:hypothetical protein